jgi:methyl-accepting chemotaxis protein
LIQSVTQNISELDGAVQTVETEIKRSRQNINDASSVSQEVKSMVGKFKT